MRNNTTTIKHPAKFSAAILNEFRQLPIERGALVLDPFAGVGTIHTIGQELGWKTVGVELEEEWANQHPNTICTDSRHLADDEWKMAWLDKFDAVVTSPCYGNRMADKYDGRDGSKRVTYRIYLNRMPSEGSACVMPFKDSARCEYKILHMQVWAQCWKVLKPGGLMVVNVSDFMRKGERVEVSRWHAEALERLAFVVEDWIEVGTPRMKMGSDGSRDLRVACEDIIIARKPSI